MNLLYLEPFYGGSHRAIADAVACFSSHTVTLCTLPPRFWKWRLRGSAFALLEQPELAREYDIVLCSSMMDLAHLRACWPGPTPQAFVYYVHEHQLDYPVQGADGGSAGRTDYSYAITNLISCAAADTVFFNSHYCLERFFGGAREMLGRMPDAVPKNVLDRVQERSTVLYPGVRTDAVDAGTANDLPLILWNHRWEHDKGPEEFFHAVSAVAAHGGEFELAVCGEQFSSHPEVFSRCRAELEPRLVHWGNAPPERYRELLGKADIVVSTAVQENFGLSVMEACAAGAVPIVPDRLVYPELYGRLPEAIYDGPPGDALKRVLALSPEELQLRKRAARLHGAEFDWAVRIVDWDNALGRLVSA